MLSKEIRYFGKQCVVTCDGNCSKAWGWNARPKEDVSNKIDDIVWLADGELEDAPKNPGTYEGGHGKPISTAEFPNKWCVRECERSVMDQDPPDWSKRVYNIPRKGNTP